MPRTTKPWQGARGRSAPGAEGVSPRQAYVDIASSPEAYTAVAHYEKRLARRALQHATQIVDSDLGTTLRQIGARRRVREHTAVIAARAPANSRRAGAVLETVAVGARITALRVQKPAGFAFVAGQHVKLGVDEASVMRAYSIASAPHEPHLEFCIEHIPQGKLSPRLSELGQGDHVYFRGKARGRFILDSQSDLHVMVATKTGIAPFRSMVIAALEGHTSLKGRIVVLHGASHVGDLAYRAEFEQLVQRHAQRLQYLCTVSRPDDPVNRGWAGAVGRVELLAGEVVPQQLSTARAPKIYLCGNAGMISSLRAEWTARGIECVSEAFD